MLLNARSLLNAGYAINNSIPAKNSGFDRVEICGSTEIDEVNGLNTVLSDTQIHEDLLDVQLFGETTIFLGHLDDSLQFGNFTSGGLPITHWNILRRDVGDISFTLIEQIPNSGLTRYLDIRAEAGQNYEYALQSVSDGTVGGQVITEEVQMDFWGWSLTSLDYNPDTNTGTHFIFDVEINTSGIQVERGRTQFDNFSAYPKISYGVRNFEGSSLTTFPLECNGNNIIEPNKATNELLKAFIEDGNAKILKNGSGRQWLVDTTGFETNYRDILTNNFTTNKNEQPYDISFTWVEIGKVI